MNTQTDSETWQVDVNGEIYQADFAELTTWVQEGALLSADKVRRGNLRWIEAGKVPVLTSFFNAKASGEPPPQISVTETKVPVEETPVPISETFSNLQPVEPAPPPMVQDVSRQDPDNVLYIRRLLAFISRFMQWLVLQDMSKFLRRKRKNMSVLRLRPVQGKKRN